jgi:hypothetical protein
MSLLDYIIEPRDEQKGLRFLKQKTQKALTARILCDAYSEYVPAGGVLHILLDDGNFDSVPHLLKDAARERDFMAETICRILMDFNENEVRFILQEGWGFVNYFETTE